MANRAAALLPTVNLRADGVNPDSVRLPAELLGLPPQLDFYRTTPPNGQCEDEALPEKSQPRMIGSGGFGSVYEAFDTKRQLWVAVKILHQGTHSTLTEGAHEWKRELFACDARRTAGPFPGIVEILDFGLAASDGVHPPAFYVVMPLVKGKPLDPQSYFHKEDKLNIGTQIAAALDFLHKNRLLHRDLKPSNILYDEETREVTIIDLGLMRRMLDPDLLEEHLRRSDFVTWKELPRGEETCTGIILGTPSYMSPEQARGENIKLKPASDVFTLGVIMWEFWGADPEVYDSAVHCVESRARHGLDFECPELVDDDKPLSDLFYQMVDMDPKNRPTATIVWRTLATIMAQICGHGYPTT